MLPESWIGPIWRALRWGRLSVATRSSPPSLPAGRGSDASALLRDLSHTWLWIVWLVLLLLSVSCRLTATRRPIHLPPEDRACERPENSTDVSRYHYAPTSL